MYQRAFLFLASLSAFLAVGAGAFGAHGLKSLFNEQQMDIYHTGVEYHLWHSLGLGLIAVLLRQYSSTRLLVAAGGLMFVGIVLFSGSLYLLAVTGIRWLGMITPFGGMAFLSAWLLVAICALRKTPDTTFN
jgi:uncharacterized membrane protein YgdD (TMEM256/DUF423 family)